MDGKFLLPAALLVGMIGGMIGQWIMPGPKSATFETVQVTKELIVAPSAQREAGCRLASDGTVTATGGLLANQVRGNLIVGHSLIASLNATQQSLDNQQIVAELTATPDRGGAMVLRSQSGVFCPSKGPANQGYETFVGFDRERGMPSIYTQDITQGAQGRSFFVCMKPQPATAQPDNMNQARAEPAQPRPQR